LGDTQETPKAPTHSQELPKWLTTSTLVRFVATIYNNWLNRSNLVDIHGDLEIWKDFYLFCSMVTSKLIIVLTEVGKVSVTKYHQDNPSREPLSVNTVRGKHVFRPSNSIPNVYAEILCQTKPGSHIQGMPEGLHSVTDDRHPVIHKEWLLV